jgi:hypothetical protein
MYRKPQEDMSHTNIADRHRPTGGDGGGSFTSLAVHPKFVWFSTPTAMGQSFIIILYYIMVFSNHNFVLSCLIKEFIP